MTPEQGTKIGSKPCESWAWVQGSYIPGLSSKAANVSGFLRV
jgi:hypothetical protein